MINLFEPNLSAEALNNLKNVFDSKWLGRGETVREFEEKVKDFLKLKSNFHTVSSCSDAIDGVFDIFNLTKGDEVIIPTNSFPSIPSSMVRRGIIPVIVDINANNGNVDIASVLSAITTKTKAVFITHYGGVPVDLSLLRSCMRPGIFIFEDSACAFGSFLNSKAIGQDADFSCWSFDAMKLLVCGEGGGFYIRDDIYFQRAVEYFYLGLPSKGKSGLDSAVSGSVNWWEYDLKLPGTRSVFTNIQAAIGLAEVGNLTRYLNRKIKIKELYDSQLRDKVKVPESRDNLQASNYFYTIQTDKRDELSRFLLKNGIYTSLRYSPIHRMSIFSNFGNSDFSGADKFYDLSLNLPIHQNLTDDNVNYITDKINEFFI